jgi:hypothetical protein
MEPLGYIPRFESMEILAEIDLRGRFLTMAADIEWTLLNIIVYSTPDPVNQLRKFKGMMMHGKIECAIADLKKYKPQLYKEYEGELNKLWEFKEIKNDLAHYKMRVEEGDRSTYIEVLYVDEDQGVERILSKQYTVDYILDAVKRFRKLNMTLLELHTRLQTDFLLNNQLEKKFEGEGADNN